MAKVTDFVYRKEFLKFFTCEWPQSMSNQCSGSIHSPLSTFTTKDISNMALKKQNDLHSNNPQQYKIKKQK